MNVELSPENVETIARRVIELLEAREPPQPSTVDDRERGEEGSVEQSPASQPSPSRWRLPSRWLLGRLHRRPRPASPLLPIRGFDANGKWVDVEFDASGNPIGRP
jgi:hypothetical protein